MIDEIFLKTSFVSDFTELQILNLLQHHKEAEPQLATASWPAVTPKEYLKPGPSFTAPSIRLLMDPVPTHESLEMFLPPQHIAQKLLDQYWIAVHPVARILNRSIFEKRYETLRELLNRGHEVPPSLVALVCAILFSAVVSMSHVDVQEGCYTSRQEMKDHLQLGTEIALGQAQLLGSAKVETLQAFVAYLVLL
jgi:hypothetical protein